MSKAAGGRRQAEVNTQHSTLPPERARLAKGGNTQHFCVRVLGLDPGTRDSGYALVFKNGTKNAPLDYGVIHTKNENPQELLLEIYSGVKNLISRHHPDVCAMEKLFFNKNVKTAMGVSEARGVMLLACAEKHIPVFEYTPIQVKCAVTGFGRATKQQMKYMVKSILRLSHLPHPDDAADALAIALCHLQSLPLRKAIEKGSRGLRD